MENQEVVTEVAETVVKTAKKTSNSLEKVEIKGVICPVGERDITVEVIPFNRRNDEHVEFAYSYSDMLYRVPSDFKNVSEAARKYAAMFIAYKEEDLTNPESDYNTICADTRACRTLFYKENFQKALQGFFEIA